MISRKMLSILGVMLIVVGVIGSFLTFNTDKETVSKERIIENENIDSVDVQSDNVKVEIRSSDESAVKVELTGTKSTNSNRKFNVDVEDNKLKVQLSDRSWKLFNFDLFTTSLVLKVHLPEEQYKSLHVSNNNGRIIADDLRVDEVNANVNNGRIEMENIIASEFHVESDNGKIILNQIEGDISGGTNNGSISLSTADLDRSIELESNNGRINIQTENKPENASFIVKVDNGRVNLFDQYDGSTVIGNGDHVIKLTTNNGSITVTE